MGWRNRLGRFKLVKNRKWVLHMAIVDEAFATVSHWLAWLFALVLSLFAVIEQAMRRLMNQLHIAHQLQSVILVLLTVALIIIAIRLFGGLFRILLAAFLVLLLLEMVVR